MFRRSVNWDIVAEKSANKARQAVTRRWTQMRWSRRLICRRSRRPPLNGTSVPTNNASDQTVVTTAPPSEGWAALPSCPDVGGNHLNYSPLTHAFSCGNTGGTVGSVTFSERRVRHEFGWAPGQRYLGLYRRRTDQREPVRRRNSRRAFGRDPQNRGRNRRTKHRGGSGCGQRARIHAGESGKQGRRWGLRGAGFFRSPGGRSDAGAYRGCVHRRRDGDGHRNTRPRGGRHGAIDESSVAVERHAMGSRPTTRAAARWQIRAYSDARAR